MDTDLTPRCRACGAPLEMVHGRGACLRSGCVLFGQVQEDCCTGVPDRADPDDAETDQPAPAVPWTPRE